MWGAFTCKGRKSHLRGNGARVLRVLSSTRLSQAPVIAVTASGVFRSLVSAGKPLPESLHVARNDGGQFANRLKSIRCRGQHKSTRRESVRCSVSTWVYVLIETGATDSGSPSADGGGGDPTNRKGTRGMKRVEILIALMMFVGMVAFSFPFLTAQSSEITNARVVEMTKLGLGDDIIIARIKTGSCQFSLSDSDLAQLKKARVSDKVIAGMLEASVLTRPRITIDGNPPELHTVGQEKIGGRLGHALSLHVKSVKVKAYLQGQHASIFASSNPAIQIEMPSNSSIDDYILVLMDGKGDRRELEVASGSGAVGHKVGIRSDRVMKTTYEPIGGHLYKISTRSPLKQGEYIIYIIGSADYEKGIFGRGYDFTVQ
jgi:hypothetical protein